MDEIKQIDAVRYPFIQAYTHFVKKPERTIVGREKEIRLILSAFCRPELSNVLLLADPGAGKAHPNDTPIATPTGFVPIGSLHAGDVVYDEMGKEVLVSGVFPQGLKRVYRVFFSDGSFIDCNDEHIWAVRNRKGHKENGSYSNLTLREMLDKGIVTKKKKPKWFIPLNGALSRENRALSMDPYVFGALISGGYFSLTDGVLHFQSKSLSVVEKVCRTFLPGGSFRRMGEDGWVFVPDAKCVDSYFTVSDMEAGVYPTTFLLYKGSFPTFIPTMYLEGSCFQRISLLQGIVDVLGDWNERGELSFSVTEKIFAQNIKELANSLGIRVMITPKYHDKEYRISYELRFLLSTKKARALFLASPLRDTEMETERTKEVTDLSITGVSDLGYEEEMTCIMVDSKTHLYQIGHEHIVTHNTALVQAVSVLDHSRVYLEVDLARMLTELANQNEMAARLKTLFDEAAAFGQNEGKELVLFIDEFHQIVQLSPAGVEALKPLLADSGTRGIRVVVATTYEEFDQYVSSNQALVERLMRINIRQPDKKMTVEILRGMARRYGVSDEFPNDNMFELIYEYTQRYMPSNSQPRKSILMLDAMVGWYKNERRRMDRKLLADVLYDTQGVDVAFKVDATMIKNALDAEVFSQDYATSAVAKRLQLCVADLNDKTKPQSSFLMTGSSGVGKGLINEEKIPVYTKDGSVNIKLNGELEVGDYVFNRYGEPVKVLAVIPRGKQDVYKVTFSDGRFLITDKDHLWGYILDKGKNTMNVYVNNTKELLDRGFRMQGRNGSYKYRYYVPMNEAVQYPERELPVHPYILGAFIGNGCLTVDRLSFSSNDEFVVKKIANLFGDCTYKHTSRRNYNWVFPLKNPMGQQKSKQLKNVFGMLPEVYKQYSGDRSIPEIYKFASAEQRWQLIQGLFDTDGAIEHGSRHTVSLSSRSIKLMEDVQWILYSLGYASNIVKYQRLDKDGRYDYRLTVKCWHSDKYKFFSLPRHLEVCDEAKKLENSGTLSRRKDYDWVAITNIEKLDEQKETTCIYVDDFEHLYQAGMFVVTHNTQLSKTLAKLLFSDDRALTRMDMTEYALPDSLERFREELTRRVWARPNCIILLDEVEKACAPVTRILLQVLDDGRLSDRNGREVSFLNAYIIMTTNAGSEVYRNIASYSSDDTGSGEHLREYDALIRRSITETTGGNRFPPELLGRVDVIVPFQPLSENTIYKIVRTKLDELCREVAKKHNVTLRYTKRVLDFVVKDNLTQDSDAGGARRAISTLEAEITTKVAKFINENPSISRIGVDIEGVMINEDKNIRKSRAYAVVKGIRG